MSGDDALRRNVELKVRLDDLAAARRVARRIATVDLGGQRQVDTYFRVPRGRLKLRVIDGTVGQLIWYERADKTGSKTSRYRLVAIGDAPGMKGVLSSACGVLVEVDKRREVFLYENVRIHLDRVVGLGTFLEFEAVLKSGQRESTGHRQLDALGRTFGLRSPMRVGCSYSDLLLAKRR